MHGHKRYHDEGERRKWQDPEQILEKIGLKPGEVFADIGCGDGFFALPATRIVDRKGLVYGIDADEESLGELRAKADKEGLGNLRLFPGPAEGVVPCEGCVDIVFFGICLHDFEDPGQVLQNARRMLKPGGMLVDLDWKKEQMQLGPPQEKRFDEAKAVALIRSAGFEVEGVADEGRYHYLIFAR